MPCRMAPAARLDPETDFVSPISEHIGIFAEADITQRAKRCVIEALGARKIADADGDMIEH
jgi:hypothetical protein